MTGTPATEPPWTVALVCGPSGVGKSSVAAPLAARYGAPLAEADDLVTALKAVTTAEQVPVVHHWDTHPEAWSWPPERIAALHLEVAEALRPAFAAVIADHLGSGTAVVVEGDYLLPELAGGLGGAVRAVVLEEPDQDRIVANYRVREPADGTQAHRARVSVRIGADLARRAAAAGVPVAAARPWADVLDRVDRALHAAPDRP